jgi:LysM repeat protein
MASTIGIKIANGEFYSIVEENSTVKRRLVLTTVHDRQRSVQIDLYKSHIRTMADALYIGSLVVEKIQAKPKGEPSIEMVISSDANGNITADAVDLDAGGEHQILNVSLQSLDKESREDEIPDFELENNGEPPAGLYKQAESIRNDEKKTFPWPVVIIVWIVIILAITAVWFFFFRDKGTSLFGIGKGRPATEQSAAGPQEGQPAQAPAEQPAAPPPLIQAPSAPPPARPQTAARTRPSAPVSSYNVPAVIPKEGVPYRIRWGDTLWDIAAAFYRNPWLYPRIARFNNIRNPNLIISGTTIRIPPKN